MMLHCLVVAVTIITSFGSSHAKPNIVWFLTDDQDQMLGGSFPSTFGENTPMPKTRELMVDQGATALNFYVHTPICCPSRAELLSSRYFHNIKQVTKGARTPDCMHVNTTLVNENTFAKYLDKAGYSVGMFGKYLNNVPKIVPEGFEAWFANGGGTYVSPSFATKNVPGIPDGMYHGNEHNYSTSIIGNVSNAWITEKVRNKETFFAYIAPKAAHEPFDPPPWYADHWDESWPKQEYRGPAWNASFETRKDHHGNIATNAMITEEASKVITGVFKNRWRTLMAVDDLIHSTVQLTKTLGVYENTYFFYSSDHGFQLGQFNILMDKRQVYDWNTKVHLLAVGPGIEKGSTFPYAATQVDLGVTFLALAGIPKPEAMDGKSLVPLLVTEKDTAIPLSTLTHLSSVPENYSASWNASNKNTLNK